MSLAVDPGPCDVCVRFPKDGCAFPPNTEKLRCFVSYFQHVEEGEAGERAAGGTVSERKPVEIRQETRRPILDGA